MENVTFFKVRQEGCGVHGFWPSLDSRRVPMSDQSDWGLMVLIFNSDISGVPVPDEVRLAAAQEFLRRYPEPLRGSGWKGWGKRAWRAADRMVRERDRTHEGR